ncbi:ABC transporter ATP-binding protein [Eionea flava]
MDILRIEGLKKNYGSVKAINDISFRVLKGSCFGLLGPNGAGKTSTLEIIEGITSPSSGKIFYKGDDCRKNLLKEIGVQFQSTALIESLTVLETLTLFSDFYINSLPIDHIKELCEIEDFIHQPVGVLSGGQRQRLLLAVALIHDPEIVFLDEPTAGLDPRSRYKFWDLIKKIKSQGKTIILTTHYMDEAEYLCDHLVIVDKGCIVSEGSPEYLLKKHFGHVFISLDTDDCPKNILLKDDVVEQNSRVTIKTNSVEEKISELISAGANLQSLRVRNPTLDDLFIKLTGCSLSQT